MNLSSPTWTDAQMASMHRMLNPRSIVVIGATERLQYGGKFFKKVLSYKDRLAIYAVNPRYSEIMGETCYPNVAALPQAPDVAAIVVPYHAVLQTMRECHEKGIPSAIVISAGFAERGEEDRIELQRQVGEFARESGMRISGPNCLGLANIRDDIWMTSSTRIESGIRGPVALVCQSGASLFGPFLARAMDGGIGMSYVVSTGNEADLEFADFARYLLDDPETKVIAGFIEGFKNADKFVEVARLALERGKPIVLIKIGRSEQGARAASSHTAALTGSDALYDAVCRQFGVIRVQGYDELLETAQLLARCPPPNPEQSGVAVVSHSGGVSSLVADMLGLAGLKLPELTPLARDGINEVLQGFGWASNPADITGHANSPSFPIIMDCLIGEPTVGTLVIASAGGTSHVEQVIDLHARTPKALVYLWTGSRYASEGLPALKRAGVPIFYTPDALARGLRHAVDYHARRAASQAGGFESVPAMTASQMRTVARLRAGGRDSLSESEGKELIEAWDVPGARHVLVQSPGEAAQAAAEMGFPVVLKVESPDILHKTEAGIVRLNLRNAEEVCAAYTQIIEAAGRYDARASITGVSVQEMVTGGVEFIVGVNYDIQLGATLVVGSGGVMVEVYHDVAMRRCPIDAGEARAMLGEVKGTWLLQGFRGKPRADIDALVRVLVSVSHLAVQLEGQLSELDINPLLVLAEGQGVKAVDALVTFKNPGA